MLKGRTASVSGQTGAGLRFLVAGVSLLVLVGAVWGMATAPRGTDDIQGGQSNQTGRPSVTQFDPPLAAPEFTLVDTRGRPFRLSDLRRYFVLLFFGYTSCPDVCPTTLGNLRQVLRQLGNDGARVRVVMVSVDPERDAPERLAAYLASMSGGDQRFIGLTGARRELEGVWSDYGVVVERWAGNGDSVGYSVAHTASIYLIDPLGRLVATYPFGMAAAELAGDLRRRL